MISEVSNGTKEIHGGVQAGGGKAGQAIWYVEGAGGPGTGAQCQYAGQVGALAVHASRAGTKRDKAANFDLPDSERLTTL